VPEQAKFRHDFGIEPHLGSPTKVNGAAAFVAANDHVRGAQPRVSVKRRKRFRVGPVRAQYHKCLHKVLAKARPRIGRRIILIACPKIENNCLWETADQACIGVAARRPAHPHRCSSLTLRSMHLAYLAQARALDVRRETFDPGAMD